MNSPLAEQIGARLEALHRHDAAALLRQGLVGLERETLRVSPQGGIARTPHPTALGSAMTHPWITTDYSEALLELITPPFGDRQRVLDFLSDLHIFVSEHLQDEFLWAASMPCILTGEAGIPIAQYGASNAGRMKHLYRVGLGYRYGKVMQVIAGVHFNFSVPLEYWSRVAAMTGRDSAKREVRDAGYMGLIRNLQRWGWLILYLFGASPAVCKSFFAGRTPHLPRFDETTLYEPYATSLRMGDIGYQNRREEGLGVKAEYDDLGSYVRSLTRAITTPAKAWESIGVKVDGEYRQLNANILQIENEYYSTIRPKALLDWLEKPVQGLTRRGIDYVELRALDIDPYHPFGIDIATIRFLEMFALLCLLTDSAPIGVAERTMIDYNLLTVSHQGRSPGLQLRSPAGARPLRIWGLELLRAMEPVAALLDGDGMGLYRDVLGQQRDKLMEPELTPSARALAEMRDRGEGFYAWANRLSQQHRRTTREIRLDPVRRQELVRMSEQSLVRQREIEAADTQDFDSFLAEQTRI